MTLAPGELDKLGTIEWYTGAAKVKSKVVKKGGPGSGHWGHKGRKGKRGGSLPSRRRRLYIDPEFSKGSGLDRKYIDDALKKVEPHHLENCKGIYSNPPISNTWDDYNLITGGKEDEATAAVYDRISQKIYINPEYTPWIEKALVHEVGHHVANGKNENPRINPDAKLNYSYEKGYTSKIWTNDKQSAIWDMAAWDLAEMGLRKYSGWSLAELSADSFMVWRMGSDEQKAKLAEFLGYDTLEDVFNA